RRQRPFAPPTNSLPRLYRRAAPSDPCEYRYCGSPPRVAHSPDDPARKNLDLCPHCGFDGDQQRLYRFRLRCCR
ncbi:MAG: hypothetical protein MUO23_13705, partial [Anaerolineales bacterium]|nr:hypothetical protein [Anaerolineales bacterium]